MHFINVHPIPIFYIWETIPLTPKAGQISPGPGHLWRLSAEPATDWVDEPHTPNAADTDIPATPAWSGPSLEPLRNTNDF